MEEEGEWKRVTREVRAALKRNLCWVSFLSDLDWVRPAQKPRNITVGSAGLSGARVEQAWEDGKTAFWGRGAEQFSENYALRWSAILGRDRVR